jgi:hypothetical protein
VTYGPERILSQEARTGHRGQQKYGTLGTIMASPSRKGSFQDEYLVIRSKGDMAKMVNYTVPAWV